MVGGIGVGIVYRTRLRGVSSIADTFKNIFLRVGSGSMRRECGKNIVKFFLLLQFRLCDVLALEVHPQLLD